MPATKKEEEDEQPPLDVDAILQQLCDEFKARNGREATADEMKQWKEQLTAAIEEGGLEI